MRLQRDKKETTQEQNRWLLGGKRENEQKNKSENRKQKRNQPSVSTRTEQEREQVQDGVTGIGMIMNESHGPVRIKIKMREKNDSLTITMKENATINEERKRSEINSTMMKKRRIDRTGEAEAARKNPDPETDKTPGTAGMTTTKNS